MLFRSVLSRQRFSVLAESCVVGFEKFREPLSESQLNRRRAAKLSADQDALLLEWGYPYVFDAFRFHMTLSERIASNEQRLGLIDTARRWFAPVLSVPITVDEISVFRDPGDGGPFRRVASAKFGSPDY